MVASILAAHFVYHGGMPTPPLPGTSVPHQAVPQPPSVAGHLPAAPKLFPDGWPRFYTVHATGGFSEASNIVQDSARREALRAIGRHFDLWWAYHRVIRARPDGREVATPQDIPGARARQLHVYGRAEGPRYYERGEARLTSAMEEFGYRYDAERDAFLLAGDSLVKPRGLKRQRPAVQPLSEPTLEVPEADDRRIYIPHMGRGQTSWYDEKAAEWEGRTDAECVRKYLRRYNAFFGRPTARTLREATESPRTDTGPFFLCMRHCFNSKVSVEVLSLFAIAFELQPRPHFEPTGKERLRALDRAVFRGLLEQYQAVRGRSGAVGGS